MTTLNTNEKFFENETGVYFKSDWPSQWYPSEFTINGVKYVNGEQFMMHKKALQFGDLVNAEKIMASEDPKVHKECGRAVVGFDDKIWSNMSFNVVFEGNLAKFSQNQDLADKLISTGEKKIVECAPYDKIWGNGLDITTTLQTSEDQWPGENRLGKVLMKVRESLLKTC